MYPLVARTAAGMNVKIHPCECRRHKRRCCGRGLDWRNGGEMGRYVGKCEGLRVGVVFVGMEEFFTRGVEAQSTKSKRNLT